MDDRQVLELALTAARGAGDIARAARTSGRFTATRKPEGSLVTEVDTDAEAAIVKAIHAKFPDHAILAEEKHSELAAQSGYGGPLWVIDPLDGTHNFAHGNPLVAVSVGFIHGGRAVAGAVVLPFLDEEFCALAGHGASLNGQPIRVTECARLADATLVTSWYHRRTLVDFVGKLRDVRSHGCAALDLCWTACGRADLYFDSVYPWDLAAGSLLVKEAGGAIGYTPPMRTCELPGGSSAGALHAQIPHAKILYAQMSYFKQPVPECLYGEGLVLGAPKIVEEACAVLASSERPNP